MEPRAALRDEGSTISHLPQAFITKRGEPVVIQSLDDKTCQGLVAMYFDYRPRNAFQGLPPLSDDTCVKWAHDMISKGINLVAVSYLEGVVGHSALFPIDDQVCELLVTVKPSFQDCGIGTQLTRRAVQWAYEIGFERVSLDVEARNLRARHVYKKCGFQCLPGKDLRELKMAVDLARYHDAVGICVRKIMNPNVIVIGADELCRTAVDVFLRKRVGSLPVVNHDRELIGILSESDLMLPANVDRHVGDIFTHDVLTVRAECTVAKIIRLFQSKRIRCIPVVDDGKRVVGIVGRKDVLAYYAKHWKARPGRAAAAIV
jgi:CBS domain-containing protein